MFSFLSFSQSATKSYSLDASYFYGNIPRHSTSISHLITGHPEGVALSFSAKTFGEEEWQQRFNYPDYGATLVHTDLKNEYLGANTSLYGHYSFYFLNRNLMLRIGEGLAYCSNPYDKESNYRNSAFGSSIVTSTFLMLNYKKENLFKNLGFEAGLLMLHYSNGNFKAPNTSVNVVALNMGLTYNIGDNEQEYIKTITDNKYTEPIKYNVVFRSGVNMSDVIGSGQYPFYVLTAYADKRLSKLSAIQFGADVFFSRFLEEYIKYMSIAFPEDGVKGDEDYKRAGLLVGHELFVNRLSLVTQLGFYVYNPINYESGMYQRIGLKYYMNKSIFGGVTLKTHAAQAEAVEFAIGVRL
ncbi:hypothetical protein Y10_14190 [Neptunitalea sp. Y10]|uniref:Acyloxyacyl hydrolase n=1 Tax=Neptunitalea lumnitzerae TaxID=2965509 RepID=A0ABQ5MI04_9FLAO|nr:hypothetical protein Y10_14190 [Neptunitalea sp. Y10]